MMAIRRPRSTCSWQLALPQNSHGVVVMYEDRKAQALETWHSLLIKPEIRMTAQEQYEELLRLA
jgi:hypothetical protein